MSTSTRVYVSLLLSLYSLDGHSGPGSRKRTALPSQNEVFRPGVRPAPAQRAGGYPLGPAGQAPTSVPENRLISRVVPDDTLHDLTRRSLSPPQPQPCPPPVERDDRDRGRARWSKPRANGPSQMDSQTTHESSRGRAYDAAMDVDDVPLTRSSDPPTKQIPPRRPALQDEVPRYPRAMLNSDNDGPPRGIFVAHSCLSDFSRALFSCMKGVREARDGTDSRHRFAADDSSRFGSSRDRQGMERHFADQTSQASLRTLSRKKYMTKAPFLPTEGAYPWCRDQTSPFWIQHQAVGDKQHSHWRQEQVCW